MLVENQPVGIAGCQTRRGRFNGGQRSKHRESTILTRRRRRPLACVDARRRVVLKRGGERLADAPAAAAPPPAPVPLLAQRHYAAQRFPFEFPIAPPPRACRLRGAFGKSQLFNTARFEQTNSYFGSKACFSFAQSRHSLLNQEETGVNRPRLQ